MVRDKLNTEIKVQWDFSNLRTGSPQYSEKTKVGQSYSAKGY